MFSVARRRNFEVLLLKSGYHRNFRYNPLLAPCLWATRVARFQENGGVQMSRRPNGRACSKALTPPALPAGRDPQDQSGVERARKSGSSADRDDIGPVSGKKRHARQSRKTPKKRGKDRQPDG